MEEIWKNIPDYEGYQVSDLGRVKSFKGNTEKILKQKINTRGYYRVNLYSNGKMKTIRIHILVAQTFLDHILTGTQAIVVDHIDENKLNNRLDNLQLITQRENIEKHFLINSKEFLLFKNFLESNTKIKELFEKYKRDH